MISLLKKILKKNVKNTVDKKLALKIIANAAGNFLTINGINLGKTAENAINENYENQIVALKNISNALNEFGNGIFKINGVDIGKVAREALEEA